MDGLIMEFFKWLTAFALMILGLVVFGFLFQIGETPTFKQHVAYEIERNGGLTTEALSSINSYSETRFKGRYKVVSDQMNLEVPFGEIVEFTVVGTYTPAHFTALGEYEIPSDGYAVSLTRD